MGRRTNTAKWLPKYSRWQIKVQKNGERKTFTCSTPGRKGQRECNDKADKWLDEGLVSPETTCQKLYDQWMEELKILTGKGHWRAYDTHWRNWIKPVIGNKKICDVTEQHLQIVINKAHKAELSKKYLKNIRAGMAAFFKYCRKCKATTLVVENVTIPRGAPVREHIILQPKDIAVVFSDASTLFKGKEIVDPFINAYRFEISTGLRPGETIGLKWSDIENNETVHLQRSINAQNEITKGKNENAVRSFVLKPIDVKILQDQRRYLLATGIRSEYVFPRVDGEAVRQSNYYNYWVRYRDYHNLPKAYPYELRHTFVSIIKALPKGLIQALVGHSADMDTFGTYAHEVDGESTQIANMVQNLFAKIVTPQDEFDEETGS